MVVRVWVENDTVLVDNGLGKSNAINVSSFSFDKDEESHTVTIKDNDDLRYSLRALSSDVHDQGGVPYGTFSDVVTFLTSIGSDPALIADLQLITDNGNTTTNDIIYNNSLSRYEGINGDISGVIGVDPDFGMVITGGDENGFPGALLTLAANDLLMVANTFAMTLKGSAQGDFIRIATQLDVNGTLVSTLGTTPLDVLAHSEDFVEPAGITLTNSFQNIIQGTVSKVYTQGSSQAVYGFKLENISNSNLVVEYSVTKNDAVPVEFFYVNMIRNQGVVNIPVFESGTDTVTGGDISVSDTVEIQARIVSGLGINILATISDPIILRMEQNASLANTIQNSASINSPGSLIVGIINDVTASGTYTIPDALTNYSAAKPTAIAIKNISGGNITISRSSTNTFYLTEGSAETSFTLQDGEYVELYADSVTQWNSGARDKRLSCQKSISLPLGTETNNITYTALGRFLYEGTDNVTTIESIDLNVYVEAAITGDIKIIRIDNGDTIIESTGISSNDMDNLLTVSSITNLPATPTILEVQAKRVGTPASRNIICNLVNVNEF